MFLSETNKQKKVQEVKWLIKTMNIQEKPPTLALASLLESFIDQTQNINGRTE